MRNFFLDANAHVPMSKKTLDILYNFHSTVACHGHPLSPSSPGREAANILEESRAKITYLLGAKSPSQIVFTSSCTQACEWGINLLLKASKSDVWCSPVEHSAVRDVVEESNIKYISVDKSGIINNINFNQDSVICMSVQNEIGSIQPIQELKAGLVFSDMCQSPGKHDINLKELPVDIAAFGAHKFGGPSGVGILYIKDLSIYDYFGTGSRYYQDRPGTPDVAGIVATASALEDCIDLMPERVGKMKEFQENLEERILDMGFEVIGFGSSRVYNTSFIKIPNSLILLMDLSSQGIYVGMGSACGSLHTGPSHTMRAINQEGNGEDFLRISQHGEYGKHDALYVADILYKSIKKYR